MCGILYAKSLDKFYVDKVVRKLYFNQRNRGMEGFGFVAIEDNKANAYKALHESDIFYHLKRHKSDEIMFHHRYPTSTKNTTSTAHPIIDTTHYKHNYYMIHNGVIFNDMALKEKHEKLGIAYNTTLKDGTYNDSECLLHELARVIDSKKDIRNTFSAIGNIAFVMLQTDKSGKPLKLFYGRNNDSPLRRTFKKLFILSSTYGDEEVHPNKLFVYNYKNNTTNSFDMKFPEHSRVVKYDSYSEYRDVKDYNSSFGVETESEDELYANYLSDCSLKELKVEYDDICAKVDVAHQTVKELERTMDKNDDEANMYLEDSYEELEIATRQYDIIMKERERRRQTQICGPVGN